MPTMKFKYWTDLHCRGFSSSVMTQKRSYLSFIKIQIQIFNGYFSIRIDFMQMLYRDSKGQMIGFFFNISWSVYFWEFQVRIVSQKSRSDSGSTPVWLGNKKVPEKKYKTIRGYFWEFQVRIVSPNLTPSPHWYQYDLVTKKYLKMTNFSTGTLSK